MALLVFLVLFEANLGTPQQQQGEKCQNSRSSHCSTICRRGLSSQHSQIQKMQTLQELNHVLFDLYKKKVTHLKHKDLLLRLLLEEKQKSMINETKCSRLSKKK